MVISSQRLLKRRMSAAASLFAIAGTALLSMTTAADAARITNPVAVFSGIDKITGRITTFDVYIGETVQFGALQVTPRVCYSRDDTEAPKTRHLRRGRRDHARPQDPPHLHRLDVCRQPRPECRRASGL